MKPARRLLVTKLFKPRVHASWVARPHLVKLLDEGVRRKLILVDAPAGYGKTTLLAQWLNAQPISSAWLSLDEADNDLGVFLAYVAEAIRTAYPDSMQATSMLLSAAELPPVDDVASMLINELDGLPDEMILVLDDYHVIRSEPIEQLMTRVVQHPPPSLHLVLTTRNDPHMPLAKLRARGEVQEIRAQELRFTAQEAGEFLRNEVADALDDRVARVLSERTEGWPAGLRLAAMSLKSAPDKRSFIDSFDSGASAGVTNFLVHEVLANLPDRMQDFLLHTAILDRFCAPLCAAVLGEDQSAGRADESAIFLDEIGRRNLFLIPLDDTGQWFRYHHLFRDLLRRLLIAQHSAVLIAGLHGRASDWFAERNLPEEALLHARAAGDTGRAARIIEANVLDILNREEWVTLSRWLAFIPPETTQGRPRLLLAHAYMKYLRNEWVDIPALIDRVEHLLGDAGLGLPSREKNIMLGEASVLRAAPLLGSGRKSAELCEQALRRLPDGYLYTRGNAHVLMAMSLQTAGLVREAEDRLSHAAAQTTTSDAFSIRILFAQWVLKWLAGEIGSAALLTERYFRATEASGLIVSIGWAHAFAGMRYHELNDLERAIEHFEVVVANTYQANHLCLITAHALLFLSYCAAGQPDRADEALRNLRAHARNTHSAVNWRLLDAIEAHLKLQRGDLAGAMQWVQTSSPQIQPAELIIPELPNLTRAQILIAQRSAGALDEALALLDELRAVVDPRNLNYPRAKVLAVQASALWRRGRNDEALRILAEAVDIGQRGGLIRTFADLGPNVLTVMRALLAMTSRESRQHEYLTSVVAAFGGAAGRAAAPEPASLTMREIEVLELLDRRRSDKEIAEALVLSRLTVSKHTANIYRKLGVGNRREAVAKARTLGLLSRAETA